MPILHVEKPREIVTLSSAKLLLLEQLVVDFRELGARISMCGPGSKVDVTPPLFRERKHILPTETLWMHVDKTGEAARMDFQSDSSDKIPGFIAVGETESNKTAMVVSSSDPGYQIGARPERVPILAISKEHGTSFGTQFAVGGLILHRTYEEMAVLMQSFGQAPPLSG